MTIIHIVMFEFKPTTEKATIDDVCTRILALEKKCIHPESKQPYIKAASGGKQNNPEPVAVYQYGFVIEFESLEDRDYYLNKDPAHLEFKKSVKEFGVKVGCLDFAPGVF